MDYVVALDVLDAPHELLHDYARLVLAETAALLQQDGQVEAISVLLDHVNLVRSLDSLVVADAVLAAHHPVDLHLFEDSLQLSLRVFLGLEDLAGVHCFRGVDSGPHCLWPALTFLFF